MNKNIAVDCIIGIDPGKNGGVAVVIEGQQTRVSKMPADMGDLASMLAYYRDTYRTLVFIEKLSVRPDDLRVQGGAADMGKLYRIQRLISNYEQLKAVVSVSDVPYVLVHPLKWAAYIGVLRKRDWPGETKVERKRRYKEFAARQFPSIKVALWAADALNIAYFGQKVLRNDPQWVLSNLPRNEQNKILL